MKAADVKPYLPSQLNLVEQGFSKVFSKQNIKEPGTKGLTD